VLAVSPAAASYRERFSPMALNGHAVMSNLSPLCAQ